MNKLHLLFVLVVVSLAIFLAETAEGAEFYFPPPAAVGEWQTIAPADAGYDRAKLDEALDYARQQRSSGVVVV